MSQLECPSCRLKIQALGAPVNCPRCLVRKGERIELLATTASQSAQPSPPATDAQSR
jgi:hypothetical protein